MVVCVGFERLCLWEEGLGGVKGVDAFSGLFVRAVEAIYGAAPDPSGWPAALQAMADVFDDVGAVLVYQRDDGGFGAISSRSLDALLHDYVSGFNGQDLRAIPGQRAGVSSRS
jgi:hypothetical protein